MRTCVLVGLALVVTACSAIRGSPAAQAQEAASDMNLNARFGRMELATEQVAPKARESFLEHRRGWGGKIRVADYELAGVRMLPDDGAVVIVRFAWYRIDNGELRNTAIQQTWHSGKTGDWTMDSEKFLDGDMGLLGEALPPPAPESTSKARTQFPTVRLGNGLAAPPSEDPNP